MTITNLAKFREDRDGPAPPTLVSPPGLHALSILWKGRMLCFDQSCTATGWVLVDTTSGEVQVLATGMAKPKHTGVKGNEDTFRKASVLFLELEHLLRVHQPEKVVHEAPPVGGGVNRNPESSAAASMAVRCACAAMGIPVSMRAPQSIKGLLTGDRGATKGEVREAVLRLVPAFAEHRPWNEHVADAAAVALVEIHLAI